MRYPALLLRAGILLWACVWLAACSSAKPEATVEALYQAAIKRDVDKALEQVSFGDISDSELFQAKGKLQVIVGEIAATAERNDGLKRLEIVESSVDEDGQSARVRIKLVFNNGQDTSESHTLRRVDGKWKVHLG